MLRVISVVAFFSLIGSAAAEARPWDARRPAREPTPAHQLRTVITWPAEPVTPAAIDPARFKASLVHLCGRRGETVGAEISDDLLAAAAASEVDPFLLAALALFQSACNPALTSPSGTGLLRIDRDMYLIPGAPKPPVEKAEWSERNLLDPKQNLSVGRAAAQDVAGRARGARRAVPQRAPPQRGGALRVGRRRAQQWPGGSRS